MAVLYLEIIWEIALSVTRNKVIEGDKHPGSTEAESAGTVSGMNNDTVASPIIHETRWFYYVFCV